MPQIDVLDQPRLPRESGRPEKNEQEGEEAGDNLLTKRHRGGFHFRIFSSQSSVLLSSRFLRNYPSTPYERKTLDELQVSCCRGCTARGVFNVPHGGRCGRALPRP